jgi:hypothetical protein
MLRVEQFWGWHILLRLDLTAMEESALTDNLILLFICRTALFLSNRTFAND